MSKITIIIGEPAVGKSSIMRELMSRSHWKYDSSTKFIPCHWQSPNRCIIGRYDDPDHPFPGTDRMSMACQPHVIQFILRNPAGNFLFEGDRLGNDKMIKALQYVTDDLVVIHIVTTQDRRRPSQSNSFRASRRTKIQNMVGPAGWCARAGLEIRTFVNDTPEDLQAIADHLERTRL